MDDDQETDVPAEVARMEAPDLAPWIFDRLRALPAELYSDIGRALLLGKQLTQRGPAGHVLHLVNARVDPADGNLSLAAHEARRVVRQSWNYSDSVVEANVVWNLKRVAVAIAMLDTMRFEPDRISVEPYSFDALMKLVASLSPPFLMVRADEGLVFEHRLDAIDAIDGLEFVGSIDGSDLDSFQGSDLDSVPESGPQPNVVRSADGRYTVFPVDLDPADNADLIVPLGPMTNVGFILHAAMNKLMMEWRSAADPVRLLDTLWAAGADLAMAEKAGLLAHRYRTALLLPDDLPSDVALQEALAFVAAHGAAEPQCCVHLLSTIAGRDLVGPHDRVFGRIGDMARALASLEVPSGDPVVLRSCVGMLDRLCRQLKTGTGLQTTAVMATIRDLENAYGRLDPRPTLALGERTWDSHPLVEAFSDLAADDPACRVLFTAVRQQAMRDSRQKGASLVDLVDAARRSELLSLAQVDPFLQDLAIAIPTLSATSRQELYRALHFRWWSNHFPTQTRPIRDWLQKHLAADTLAMEAWWM